VGLHGGLAQVELGGDLRVRAAAAEEEQHLALARRQVGELGRVRLPAHEALDQAARHAGREQRVAPGDHADGVDEVAGSTSLSRKPLAPPFIAP
jgi:hypothetical protein